MTGEIELIQDGDGVAVIGETGAIELFLNAHGLPSKDLGLPRLSKVLGAAASGGQAAATSANESGRWVKLTAESAAQVKKYGLTPKGDGISYAMIGRPGASKKWLQIEKGVVSKNPALIANAPALMTQIAMQQAIAEIADYLASIDAKLDDVLRAQKDGVVAKMVGVGLQIEEAMAIREHVGRVNEVIWSKVQDTAGTIAETQAYALLQLDALAEKLEKKTSVADLMKTAKDAETKTRDWLAVLARSLQLQEAVAVLELDRVLAAAPDDLPRHRDGLQAARAARLDAISTTTSLLVERMQQAAETANSRVLFNPVQSPAVIESGVHVTTAIGQFQERLGVSAELATLEKRRWKSALADVRDRAKSRGADALAGGATAGRRARDRASHASEKMAHRLEEISHRLTSAERPEDTSVE